MSASRTVRSASLRSLSVVAICASVLLGVPPAARAATADCIGTAATIVGTDAADVLVGTPGDDVISAGEGADTVDGGGGDDLVCPGPGDDTVDGGTGVDTVAFEGGAPTRANLLTGKATGRLGGVDLLAGLENLWGGDGADVLVGDGGPNEIHGRGGADVIDAGAGADVCAPDRGTDTVRACESGSVLVFAGQQDTFTLDLPSTELNDFVRLASTAYRSDGPGSVRWTLTRPDGFDVVSTRRADVDAMVRARWLTGGKHVLTIGGSDATTTGFLAFTVDAPVDTRFDVPLSPSLEAGTPVTVSNRAPNQNIEIPFDLTPEMLDAQRHLSFELTGATFAHPDDVVTTLRLDSPFTGPAFRDLGSWTGVGTHAVQFDARTDGRYILQIEPAGEDVGSVGVTLAVPQPLVLAIPRPASTLAAAVPFTLANEVVGQDVYATFTVPREWVDKRILLLRITGATWDGNVFATVDLGEKGPRVIRGFGDDTSLATAGTLPGPGTYRLRIITRGSLGSAQIRIAAQAPALYSVPVLDSLDVQRTTRIAPPADGFAKISFTVTPAMVAQGRALTYRLSSTFGLGPRSSLAVLGPDGLVTFSGTGQAATRTIGQADEAGVWTMIVAANTSAASGADLRIAAVAPPG